MGKAAVTCSAILAVLGLALVGVGVALIFVFPGIIKQKVEQNVALKPKGASFDNWKTPPAPVYLKIHFFDVVNPNEIVNKGSKPQVEERGPYTYREIKTKMNITFLENGTMVKYREPKSYVFQRNMSAGPENDTFTMINFPILTFATFMKDQSSLVKDLAKVALGVFGEKLFTNYTVSQYLFGFKEPTMEAINNFTRRYLNKTFDALKNDTFGLFYGPTGNGTADGTYEIYTGVGDIEKMSLIHSWNNKSSLPYWNSSYCNMINGSDGQSWHPYMKKTETLYLYSSDVCRSLYVTYEEDQTLKGIHMNRFSIPPEVLANHTTNPDNRCYCTAATGCLGAGVVDIGACKQDSPLILSLPHFYQGDARYVAAVGGMRPDKVKHETVIDVEPYTGAVLNAAKKLQFNMYIQKLGAWGQTDEFKEPIIFPMLWLSESGTLTDKNAADFKDEVLSPMRTTQIIQYTMIGAGGLILLAVCVFLVVRLCRRQNKGGPLLVTDQDDCGLLDPSNVST